MENANWLDNADIGDLGTVVFSGAALLNFRGDAFLAFDGPTREAVGTLLVRMRGQAYGVNEMFWELWLLPFGWLVILVFPAALARVLGFSSTPSLESQ